MKTVQSQSTSNPCSISQAASVAALNGSQDCIQTMLSAFKQRHDFVVQRVNQIPGFKCLPADGAFYMFINVAEAMRIKGFSRDADFASAILEQVDVAAVPGSGFGAEGYLRISFATSMELLEEALNRIDGFMR